MGWVVGIVGLTATVTGTPKVKTCLLYFKQINKFNVNIFYLFTALVHTNQQTKNPFIFILNLLVQQTRQKEVHFTTL